MAKEEIISQKVVSKKKVVKEGYLKEKFGNLSESISAFCMAPILILLAFGLLYYSETFHKSSAVVGQLPIESAADVSGESGLHKVGDKVVVMSPANAPELGAVLYFEYVKEMYEEVEETDTETVTTYEDGEEYEETIETTKLVEKWVEQEKGEPTWADFSLGDLDVNPAGATLKLDLQKAEYWVNEYDEYEKLEKGTSQTPYLYDERLVVQYLDTDEDLIVIGDVNNGTISKGDEFIITNKSEAQLQEQLETEDSTWFWIMKFIVWLLIVIGLTSIVGPIIALVDFIPLFGKAAKTAAGIIAAIIALIVVLIGSFLIRYWWLLLILVVVVIVALVILLVVLMKKQKK